VNSNSVPSTPKNQAQALSRRHHNSVAIATLRDFLQTDVVVNRRHSVT
jgi:hypothetical protein